VKTLSAIEDMHWAMVDSAHAALMVRNQTPPSPEHIPDMLIEVFVKHKKLEKHLVEWYNELYELAHAVKNNKIQRIPGEDFEKWFKRTNDFTRVMERLAKEGEKEFLKRQ
jgi:uncharacterized protein (UPF0332 family)